MKNVSLTPDDYLYCACIFAPQNKEYYDYLIQKGIEPWIGAGVTQKSLLRVASEYGAKRRKIYADVVETFSEYEVFVGGSSSFDMAPKPYNKYYAIDLYCKENGLSHENIVFIGDDYGLGGNDESVYKSDINYLTIDNFEDFPTVIKPLLK